MFSSLKLLLSLFLGEFWHWNISFSLLEKEIYFFKSQNYAINRDQKKSYEGVYLWLQTDILKKNRKIVGNFGKFSKIVEKLGKFW